MRVGWNRACTMLCSFFAIPKVLSRRFRVFAYEERPNASSNPDVLINLAALAATLAILSAALSSHVCVACLPLEEGYHGLERARASDQLRSAGVRQDGEGDAPRRPAVEALPPNARREPLLGRLRREGSLWHSRQVGWAGSRRFLVVSCSGRTSPRGPGHFFFFTCAGGAAGPGVTHFIRVRRFFGGGVWTGVLFAGKTRSFSMPPSPPVMPRALVRTDRHKSPECAVVRDVARVEAVGLL